jgi:hypothetical protein
VEPGSLQGRDHPRGCGEHGLLRNFTGSETGSSPWVRGAPRDPPTTREPSGFAAVLQGLMVDRAWDLPAAGGTVMDRWPDIAAAISSRLPGHVAAVAYHLETG